MTFKSSRFLKVLSIALTIAVTIALLSPTISHSIPAPPATQSSDASINDRPSSTETFIPTNLSTERTLPPNSTERGIICSSTGCDERVPMRSNSYPWSAIGYLKIGDSHCTATLTHESWIVTSAHCVVDDKTGKITKDPITFFPNRINKSAKDSARVTYVVVGTTSDRVAHPKDWAMLKLDKPLGRTYGTIGLKSLPLSQVLRNPKKFMLAGYSGDFPSARRYPDLTAGPGYTAGVDAACSITGEQNDTVLIHDCDARGGASGGALMTWIQGKPYIVAINSAEFTDRRTGEGIENYAIDIVRVIEWIAKPN